MQSVQNLAKLIGGTIGLLTSGEVRPNADIAVILGK